VPSEDNSVTSIPVKSTVQGIVENFLNFKDPPLYYYDKLYKVLECRTGRLGYHIDVCDHCAVFKSLPNSCCHSLCPDCQERLSRNWIKNRISELLPAPYYQLVFPLIDTLSVFAMYNKKNVFDIFFYAVSSAIQKIPKQENIEIGFIISLITNAANMWFDPHCHVCMPGIGIQNGEIKFYDKSLPFTKEILSEEFRDIFLEELEKLYFLPQKETLTPEEIDKLTINWPDELKHLQDNESAFKKWIEELKKENWNIFIGDPTTDSAGDLIRYIGKRAPILNNQIIEADNEQVIFRDKRRDEVKLSIEEFVRRLVSHSMPSGYHRIRNYGFLSNSTKEIKISYILGQLDYPVKEKETESNNKQQCKKCGEGHMRTVGVILGGETVKTCKDNIRQLRIIPLWVDLLEIIEKSKTIPLELRFSIPAWLLRLIESVDQ